MRPLELNALAMNLKQLAKELGLSQTTVSRALSGYPEVKPATRLRVAEAAAALGYRPNVAALGLATGRSRSIGMILRGGSEFGPHLSEFLGGVGERLAHDEMDISLTNVESYDDELRAYRRFAQSKRVDAVILHSPTPMDERAQLLSELGLPFVLHGRTDIGQPIPWLDIDNRDAARASTLHLLGLGHRRIGLINGPAGMTFAEHREQGYRDALLKRGLKVEPQLIANGRFTDETGFRVTHEFLDRHPRPTAIVAGSMMSALGIMRAIRSRGLQLGKDISLIAHDDVFDYLNADNMVPSITTTRSSMRAAGFRVAELILQLLAGTRPESIHELWPVELVVRQSTGTAPTGR
jgi:LacI family transcriptional regulator